MSEHKEKSKIIFAGTSEFGIPTFEKLISNPDFKIVAALTQPDRRKGRGQKLGAGPIKEIAFRHKVPLLQPFELKKSGELEKLFNKDIDFLVVVSYGLLIPKIILDSIRFCINVHASVLPKLRGASPIQHAIMNGDEFSGISIMQITEELDAGPIYCSETVRLKSNETYGSLSSKLARMGSEKLIETIYKIKREQIEPQPQDNSGASYAAKISKKNKEINWTEPATYIERQVRALSPSPGAISQINGLKIKIYEVRIEKNMLPLKPGEWSIDPNNKRIIVGTSTESISIVSIQRSGGKIMLAKDFINGFDNKKFNKE